MRLERTCNGPDVFRNGAFNIKPEQFAMSPLEDTVAGTRVQSRFTLNGLLSVMKNCRESDSGFECVVVVSLVKGEGSLTKSILL